MFSMNQINSFLVPVVLSLSFIFSTSIVFGQSKEHVVKRSKVESYQSKISTASESRRLVGNVSSRPENEKTASRKFSTVKSSVSHKMIGRPVATDKNGVVVEKRD